MTPTPHGRYTCPKVASRSRVLSITCPQMAVTEVKGTAESLESQSVFCASTDHVRWGQDASSLPEPRSLGRGLPSLPCSCANPTGLSLSVARDPAPPVKCGVGAVGQRLHRGGHQLPPSCLFIFFAEAHSQRGDLERSSGTLIWTQGHPRSQLC